MLVFILLDSMGPNRIFLNYHPKHTMDFLVKQDSFVGWVGLSLSLSKGGFKSDDTERSLLLQENIPNLYPGQII